MVRSEDLAATWSRHWNSGQTESSPDESVNLAPVDTAWRSHFAGLADGSRILDLATGGGHVLRQGVKAAANLGRTFEIHGVDLAELAAVAKSLPAHVMLTGNVDVAALPFENAQFDSVVSQFGIEYADPDRAYAEALRVLKAGRRGQFILHHRQGAIVSAAHAKLSAFDAVFAGDGVFRQAQEAFEHLARRDDLGVTDAAISRFRTSVAELEARLQRGPQYRDAGHMTRFLRDLAQQPQRFDAAEVMRRISGLRSELDGWQLRQRALIEAALDRGGMDRVAASLRENGAASVTIAEIGTRNDIVAWCCAFEKNPP